MENTNSALFTMEEKGEKEPRNMIFYQKATLQLLSITLQSHIPFFQYWKSPFKYPETQASEGGMWLSHSLLSQN